MRPDQLELLTTLGRPAVHPDGSWAVVAATRPDFASDSYLGQLWRVPLDGSGEPRRLTRGRSDSQPRFSPDGSLLGFLRPDDDRKAQLWLVPTDGGEAMQVTDQPLGVGDFRFSPDGSQLAFVARVPEDGRYGTVEGIDGGHEDPRRFEGLQLQSNGLGWHRDRPRHLFLVEVPDVFGEPFVKAVGRVAKAQKDEQQGEAPANGFPTARQLTDGDADDALAQFTADGSNLLFVSQRHPGRGTDLARHLYRVPVSGGEVEQLTPTDQPVGVGSACPSGDSLFLGASSLGPQGTDFVGHNTSVWLLDDRSPRQLVDPEDFALADELVPDGRGGVLAIVARRGDTALVRVDVQGQVTTLLEGDLVVESVAAVPGSQAVVAVVADARSTGELCLVSEGQARPLTQFSRPLQEQTHIVAPRELVASSADGYPVHGWVLVPEGEGPHPVLLNIHGGPFASYQSAWFDEFQTWVEAGYAVVACNPRGSQGYGQSHGQAIKGDFGNLDMADVLAFLDHALAQTEGLDAGRIGIMGGSYGGYLTAWIIGHDHRWGGAIVERGFLDPRSFVGASDIGWYFTGEYNTTDPQTMDAQSPMHLTDQVSTPTLVLHSEDDLRCPLGQALRYYTQLKLAGVESELLVFPGENHELSRSGTPWHRRQRLEAVLDWWGRHL